jgi:hypothetical protein
MGAIGPYRREGTARAKPSDVCPCGRRATHQGPLMTEVTLILNAIEQGDPHAAAQLWKLV